MTQLAPTRDGQPVLHIEINEDMTQEDFRVMWTKINQAFNDKRYAENSRDEAMEQCDEE